MSDISIRLKLLNGHMRVRTDKDFDEIFNNSDLDDEIVNSPYSQWLILGLISTI